MAGLLIHSLKPKPSERDICVCVEIVCPHCQKFSPFKLRQLRYSIAIFGIRLADLDRSYQLCCANCNFRKDIEPLELFPAMRAKRLHKKLSNREITPDQYVKALDALKFPALQELRKSSETWSCQRCSENVPQNFSSCWKCTAPRPAAAEIISIDQREPPRLPYGITRPSNPWEG